jgi:TonB-linked SusC/RagA family outer membrane protein
MRKLSLFLFAILAVVCATAANVKITGVVMSASDDEPLVGASVTVKGASSGTSTDFDGKFSVEAPVGSKLMFSYIGYTGAEYDVKGEASNIEIRLKEDSNVMDEVVVIGYGVQKKSVVTASISSIDADRLEQTSPVRVDNALKGLTSGVTVTSASGQPGDAARVRIRGIGTINNSDPLYIVDGMPIEGGIDYLNPNDVKSIEVLKDAASGAVYGARAANGVILVTTKNGSLGKAKITYDFSYGWQSAWKKRDVLNATEYAIMMNEGSLNAGIAAPYSDPYSYGTGFDWQDAVFNDNAPVMNHQVSVSGANEKLNYFLSLGYYTQDGIVGGNYGRSDYQRLTLRSNNVYTVFDKSKERNWLNNFKLTVNVSYARVKSHGIETNSTWGSPLGSALSISPMLTPYATGDLEKQQNDYYAGNSLYVPLYSSNGQLFLNPEVFGNYQEMSNPLANLSLPGDLGWSHKFVGNFIGELQLWDNLKYRISYGTDLSFYGSDGYTIPYYLRSGSSRTFSTAYSTKQQGCVWQIENTLSYDKTINEHTFSVLLGQSAKESSGNYLYGARNYIIDYDRPYLDASTGLAENGDMTATGAPYAKSKLASLFARLSYDYDSRYMAQFTIRRDGSSRFGSNNHWATFPSFSLGWNLTNEPYMQNRPTWLTNTKVRFSWGKNGNENIGDFQYVALVSTGNNAIFGKDEAVTIGSKPSVIPNKNLKWEESTQTDVGLDFGFLNNSLTFTIDYYKKITDGMLMTMSIPSYVGESLPIGNVGKMENSGVEMEANYRTNFGEVTFGVGGNLTYLKNKLIEYGNTEGWANLDSFQGVGTISRAENGEPFPFFYGYKTDGLLQNQAEADAYNALYGDTAVPGDVRFVDVNGDGKIDDNDRTKIGKGMPDWTYGFNFNVEWKGIALSAMFQGTIGNDIFDATRRVDAISSNLPSWMLGRWTGEGTSTRIPRYVRGDSRNWVSSDLYVYNGDYMRLKNLSISYTLPKNITRKVGVENFRVYVSGENLLTFTKYHGYDPEISSGGTSLGIDYGVYPQARVYTVGFNIQF